MDRGALWATVHGVTKCWAQLKRLSTQVYTHTHTHIHTHTHTHMQNAVIKISVPFRASLERAWMGLSGKEIALILGSHWVKI